MRDGRRQMADGRWQMLEGRWQMSFFAAFCLVEGFAARASKAASAAYCPLPTAY